MTKNYDFYEEYIGQKTDYQTYKTRLRLGHPPERAIYPGHLKVLTRGYTLEDKIEEKRVLREKLSKIKKELYKSEEFKEIKRQLNIVSSTISNLRKQAGLSTIKD